MENYEPAFPIVMHPGSPDQYSWPGLTKREYFAAMALQGLLANPDYNCPSRPKDIVTTTGTAKAALHYADALLKELSNHQS